MDDAKTIIYSEICGRIYGPARKAVENDKIRLDKKNIRKDR